MLKKIFSFFTIITIFLLFSFIVSCKPVSSTSAKTIETDPASEESAEAVEPEETPGEAEEEDITGEIEPAEDDSGENFEESVEPEEEPDEEITEEQEEEGEETTDEDFLNILLSFLDAVKTDSEYAFFSSATIIIVGTEEEYLNGTQSDFYFIIKESHSTWENIVIDAVTINGDTAFVDIIGDRMAEGTLYEDENITFRFVKENGDWKIDFG